MPESTSSIEIVAYMKFGKTLTKVRSACKSHWASKWLDYKSLKIKIKGLRASSCKKGLTPLTPTASLKNQDLRSDPKEIDFFAALHRELKNADVFIGRELKSFLRRYRRTKDSDFNENIRLQDLVVLYRDCVELEAYAVTQYCAFSKILKKHDKRTG